LTNCSRAGGCAVFNYPFLTSKERDNETNLDYFLARYYSSVQGRFTSPDPLLESAEPKRPQSWNRYTYVLNNPLKFVDPDGLRWAQQVRDDGKTYYQWFGTDEDYDNALGNGWSAVTFDESKPFEYVSDYGVGGERNSLYVLNPDGTHGFWQTLEYGQAGSSGDFADQLALTGLFQGALKGVVGLLGHESAHGAARNASTAVVDEAAGLWPGRGTGRFIIRGIEYTEHAIERMVPRGLGGRGVPVSVVENAIKNGTKSAGNQPGTVIHVFENVRVVTNQAANRVITVITTGN
jgi:RHS repeat-associated protein